MMAFGSIFQLGYLVEALEPAMMHWTRTLGAGPFFVLPPRVFHDLMVDGEPSGDARVIDAVALGQLGSLQIELIVPGPARSTYSRFLEANRPGLHHLGMLTRDFAQDRAVAIERGYRPETEARTGLTRIAYLRPPAPEAGSVVELVEENDLVQQTFGAIRQASIGWDGRDPVRAL